MMTLLIIGGKTLYFPVLNDTTLVKDMIVIAEGMRYRVSEHPVANADTGELLVPVEKIK